MTPPEIAAGRLGAACLLGLALGFLYGFLRPLRPKFTAPADGLFLLCAAGAWLYLSFAVCGGDLRPGYWAGLPVGGFAWEATAGRLLRPVFSAFWRFVFRIFAVPLGLMKKFFKKTGHFAKNIFASAKKWGTIGWNNRRAVRRASGGHRHGKPKKSLQPDPAGVQAQPPADQDRGPVRYRVVYGDTSGPGLDV